MFKERSNCSKVEHTFVADTSAEPELWTFSRSSASLRGSSSHPHRSITGFRVINDFPLFSATLVNMLKPLASQYARCEQHHRRKLLEKRSTSTFGGHLPPTLSLGGRRYYVTDTDCTR